MRGRALLISNRRYGDTRLAEIPSAEADVTALSGVLSDRNIGDFSVATLTDVSCQNWREALEEFYAEAARDETLLLYISSHGIKDQDGRLFFCATDTNVRRLLATGISTTFVQESAFRSRCKRQIMILDSCFAGAFARGYTLKSAGAIGSGEYFRDGGGRIVITASDEMQYAFGEGNASGEPKPSVFTRHLVEGLRSGAADQESIGYITVDSIFRYIEDRLLEEGAKQSPQKWAFGLSGDIIIARNPFPKPGKVPVEVGEMIHHPDPRVRIVAVSDLLRLAHSKREALRLAAVQALHALGEDDSRAVSNAAAKALAELLPSETQHPNVSDQKALAASPESISSTTPHGLEIARTDSSISAVILKPPKFYKALFPIGVSKAARITIAVAFFGYGLSPFIFRSRDTILLNTQIITSVAVCAAAALLVITKRFRLLAPAGMLFLAGLLAYRATFYWWPVQVFDNIADLFVLWCSLVIYALIYLKEQKGIGSANPQE